GAGELHLGRLLLARPAETQAPVSLLGDRVMDDVIRLLLAVLGHDHDVLAGVLLLEGALGAHPVTLEGDLLVLVVGPQQAHAAEEHASGHQRQEFSHRRSPTEGKIHPRSQTRPSGATNPPGNAY